MNSLPAHRTKIIATIGPASASPEILERMIRAGMSIARLNFSHGDFADHARHIRHIRAAAQAAGRRVAILADLPGPKLRLGRIEPEHIELRAGDRFTLTAEDIVGDPHRASTTCPQLPRVVRPGDSIYLNDGLVQLEVEAVSGPDVVCRVVVGGELRSRKGLNLPGVDLGIRAFTERDRECLDFALAHGVEAVSQSFVSDAADLEALRDAARAGGHEPFVVAKIERARALQNFDAILSGADGIMIARGDLGVEVPLEQMTLVQKDLIARASRAGKPAIVATQMLESMTAQRLPTRAEASDVANAILDGTDAVMLSAESAIGRYPVEAVAMLARIAAYTEQHRRRSGAPSVPPEAAELTSELSGLVTEVVTRALDTLPCAAVFVPTRTGATAQRLSRWNPPVWIIALCSEARVCPRLLFCYGVHPVECAAEPEDWRAFARDWLRAHGLSGSVALLVAGPSPRNPGANHRIEFLELDPEVRPRAVPPPLPPVRPAA